MDSRLKKIIQSEEQSMWRTTTEQVKEQTNITDTDLTGEKPTVKRQIRTKINHYFKKKIETDSNDKSKVKHLLNGRQNWAPQIKPKYVTDMPRKYVSIIF